MKAAPLTPNGTLPPLHVAVIMDGNGRWAKARGLPRTAGHHRGMEAAREIVEAAADFGVSVLTLFGFSSENWNRPQGEIRDLMGLLRLYLRNEVGNLHKNGVRLRIVGERSALADDIVSLIEEAEARTKDNTRMTLVIALNYGGRQEIASAARRIAEAVKAGTLNPDDVSEAVFSDHLFMADLPDPDLLIRTSGEQRVSNFLLWQLAYTEFVFVDTLWPDFSREMFRQAVVEFQGRERRFGMTGG
ncbi:MAG: isoprenyl transferase [Alphaproteobacteria bacterium]|nr:isoprenyl transferase [Alphaproteobacteria bacterium]MBL6945953.1 isoprenyl transferase [Rhodospirillales bacterium]